MQEALGFILLIRCIDRFLCRKLKSLLSLVYMYIRNPLIGFQRSFNIRRKQELTCYNFRKKKKQINCLPAARPLIWQLFVGP